MTGLKSTYRGGDVSAVRAPGAHLRPEIEPVINAHSWATMLGGSTLRPSVRMAMADAVQSYADIFALQEQMGRHVANITSNEAAYITNGAAAGLVIALLAIFTSDDAGRIRALPARSGEINVVIQKAQRNPYDHAIELAGGRFDVIGSDSGTSADDLERALDRRPTACLYVLGAPYERAALPLEAVVSASHRHGIPVIVDAAAQLPPASNLWRLTRDIGADVAVFSGGKELRGPQNSGFIVGRADIVKACNALGPPRQTMVRALKVSREGMMGLAVALEEYLAEGDEERIARRERIVRDWLQAWGQIPGVKASRAFPNVAGQPIPRAALEIDRAVVGFSAEDLGRRLMAGMPKIAVMVEGNVLYANPSPLDEGDAEVVRDTILRALKGK